MSASPPLPNPVADDEIDLRDLVAALGRRWRWVLAGLVLGVGFGGLAASRQVPQLTLRLVVNLEQGPQVPSGVSMDRSDALGPLLVTTFKPLIDITSARLQLEQLVPPAQRQLRQQGWEVSFLKFGKDISSTALALTATVPVTEKAQATAVLERIARDYRQENLRMFREQPKGTPPQANWVQLLQDLQDPQGPGRSLALGGFAGTLLGIGLALVADRRSQRVYGLNRLQQLFPYPVWGTLPPAYPHGPLSGQAEAQLAVFLRRQLAWQVCSIAEAHPLLTSLVEGLNRVDPQLNLQTGPVLLREPFNPARDQSVGCLLLVEPGFNSELALRQAQQLLQQLPGVEQVALVLAGQPLAPELRLSSQGMAPEQPKE